MSKNVHEHDHETHQQTKSTAALHQKLSEGKAEQDKREAELLTHPSYIELQQKLTETEEKAAQNWDQMLRVRAEADNTIRRVERDVANAHKYGQEKFVNELLPVIDNLERSLDIPDQSSNAVLEGIKLTLQMFYAVLEKFGVTQVNPAGEAFNPEQHQAVSVQIDDQVKPGTVLSVLQKGYLLNNRLIRPAFVVVSKSSIEK